MNIYHLPELFRDEEAAREYIETRLWPDGPRCPVCASGERITIRKNGRYRCNVCKYDFSVRTGTIFERSHVPLYKWLCAIRLIAASPRGISSVRLSNEIGVTQKTAWSMLRRIREDCGSDLSKLMVNSHLNNSGSVGKSGVPR